MLPISDNDQLLADIAAIKSIMKQFTSKFKEEFDPTGQGAENITSIDTNRFIARFKLNLKNNNIVADIARRRNHRCSDIINCIVINAACISEEDFASEGFHDHLAQIMISGRGNKRTIHASNETDAMDESDTSDDEATDDNEMDFSINLEPQHTDMFASNQ